MINHVVDAWSYGDSEKALKVPIKAAISMGLMHRELHLEYPLWIADVALAV